MANELRQEIGGGTSSRERENSGRGRKGGKENAQNNDRAAGSTLILHQHSHITWKKTVKLVYHYF